MLVERSRRRRTRQLTVDFGDSGAGPPVHSAGERSVKQDDIIRIQIQIQTSLRRTTLAMATIPKKTPASRRARSPRPDGVATRQHLLEIAGQLFAERGFADTTSKEICERA